jgi:hypothetical protein
MTVVFSYCAFKKVKREQFIKKELFEAQEGYAAKIASFPEALLPIILHKAKALFTKSKTATPKITNPPNAPNPFFNRWLI